MASLIDVCGLMKKLDTTTVKKRAATKEELTFIHDPAYIDKVEEMSGKNGGDAGDFAFFGPGSYHIAALAAGCCIEAVNSGEAEQGAKDGWSEGRLERRMAGAK